MAKPANKYAGDTSHLLVHMARSSEALLNITHGHIASDAFPQIKMDDTLKLGRRGYFDIPTQAIIVDQHYATGNENAAKVRRTIAHEYFHYVQSTTGFTSDVRARIDEIGGHGPLKGIVSLFAPNKNIVNAAGYTGLLEAGGYFFEEASDPAHPTYTANRSYLTCQLQNTLSSFISPSSENNRILLSVYSTLQTCAEKPAIEGVGPAVKAQMVRDGAIDISYQTLSAVVGMSVAMLVYASTDFNVEKTITLLARGRADAVASCVAGLREDQFQELIRLSACAEA